MFKGGILEEAMMSSTEVSIILGQSDAIEEAHSVRKQALELSQQRRIQQEEDKRKQEKDKLKEFESEKRIEAEGEKRKEGDREDMQKGRGREQSGKESSPSEGTLIDIKV